MQRQSGFTIIEVLLFLAISTMLLLVALNSISASINMTRFGDAVRTTESFLQRQYNEVSTGRNVRTGNQTCVNGVFDPLNSSTPGTTTCVVLGRLITLETQPGSTGRILSRYIIARDAVPVGGDESAKIRSLNPAVFGSSDLDVNFTNPWSIPYVPTTSGDVNAMAIIRSPVSGRMLIYTFGPYAFTSSSLGPAEISQANLGRGATLCLRSDDFLVPRVGLVRILAGQGQDVIKADLTVSGSTCP